MAAKVPAAGVDLDGAVTVNESSADVDFRIETNGNANMFLVDGGNDAVIFNGSTSNFASSSQAVQVYNSGLAFTSGYGIQGGVNADRASINLTSGSDGHVKFNVNNSEVARFTSGGLAIGGTGAANTLDDYEEGNTSDLTLSPGTSGSISLQDGFRQLSYTKVGRLVTITGILKITSVSSPTGAPTFTLPFVLASNSDIGEITRGHGYVVNAAAAENGDGGLIIEVLTAGSATASIFKTDNTTNGLRDFDSTFATSQAEICFSFSYFSA